MYVFRGVTIGIAMAGVILASTPEKRTTMTTTANAAGQTGSPFRLRPLAIANPKKVDGLRIVERRGAPTLLFSTQASNDGQYQLVIHAAPIASIAEVTEVARVDRLLPVPPQWDARPVGNSFELLYEVAGGAVNAIAYQDSHGEIRRVSTEHPFETFGRPHFVGDRLTGEAPDVATIAQLQKLVVFLRGTTQQEKYRALADGEDGVVVDLRHNLYVTKSEMSGPAMFDVLPGRLTIHVGESEDRRSTVVPDVLAYELDADALGSDLVVFATSKPAFVVVGRRPQRTYRLEADDAAWVLQLSRPAVLVSPDVVHVAAIANPGSDQAVILYGAIPTSALAR